MNRRGFFATLGAAFISVKTSQALKLPADILRAAKLARFYGAFEANLYKEIIELSWNGKGGTGPLGPNYRGNYISYHIRNPRNKEHSGLLTGRVGCYCVDYYPSTEFRHKNLERINKIIEKYHAKKT